MSVLAGVRRPTVGEALFAALTIVFVAIAAYSSWATVGRFLLIDADRRPPIFILVGILSLLPSLVLFLGQLLLVKHMGSVTLCITGVLIAGLSIIAYGDAPASIRSGYNPLVILFGHSDASIDLRRTYFVAAFQLVVVLCGIVGARVMSRWSDAG